MPGKFNLHWLINVFVVGMMMLLAAPLVERRYVGIIGIILSMSALVVATIVVGVAYKRSKKRSVRFHKLD